MLKKNVLLTRYLLDEWMDCDQFCKDIAFNILGRGCVTNLVLVTDYVFKIIYGFILRMMLLNQQMDIPY